MDFVQYIKPELFILIPVLYLIGVALKKSTIKDKFIPLLLGATGIVLALIWVLASCDYHGKEVFTAVFTAITQGILCAGASVYANQIVKQITKKEE